MNATSHIQNIQSYAGDYWATTDTKMIADDQSAIPALLRGTMKSMLEEVRQLEVRIEGAFELRKRSIKSTNCC